MITAFFEHLASAEAMAGESSAVPFDVIYFEGITHVVFLGDAATAFVARSKNSNEVQILAIILKS